MNRRSFFTTMLGAAMAAAARIYPTPKPLPMQVADLAHFDRIIMDDICNPPAGQHGNMLRLQFQAFNGAMLRGRRMESTVVFLDPGYQEKRQDRRASADDKQ